MSMTGGEINLIMGKNKRLEELTKHHILPRSRGRGGEPLNIVLVTRREHQNYHNLFGNRTPSEILNYLQERFWKIEDRYWKIEHY